MRSKLRLLALACLIAVAGLSALAGAQAIDPVVAKVGKRSIALTELSQRLERLADFQLDSFGKSAQAQGRQYLERVAVPEMLLAEYANKIGLSDKARAVALRNAILRDALVARLAREAKGTDPVTDDMVRRYYDDHPELFAQNERIRIQRLLVTDRAEAQALLDRAKRFATMDEWRNLVREKSIDKATSERQGELGFVAADGSTDVPELEVLPALFAAAQQVRDGELVPEPVAEGKHFAIVWRRGTRPPRAVDFSAEAPQIREHLTQLQAERRLNELLVRLKKDFLKEYHPEPPERISFAEVFERGFSKSTP